MTSEIGVERVVEPHFLFHCSCGAAIETSERMVTCSDCGETVEVLRCIPTPNGNKYKLRISKHRHGWHAEPCPSPVGCVAAFTSATRHHHEPDSKQLFHNTAATRATLHSSEPPDYNERCLRLGLLILLAPLWLPLVLMVLSLVFAPATVEQARSDDRIIETPKPTDCGPFSRCHYEKGIIHVKDKQGMHTIITWQRVDD